MISPPGPRNRERGARPSIIVFRDGGGQVCCMQQPPPSQSIHPPFPPFCTLGTTGERKPVITASLWLRHKLMMMSFTVNWENERHEAFTDIYSIIHCFDVIQDYIYMCVYVAKPFSTLNNILVSQNLSRTTSSSPFHFVSIQSSSLLKRELVNVRAEVLTHTHDSRE